MSSRVKLALAVGGAVVVVGLIALGSLSESSKPGNPAVYDRINSETDCDTLQAEFNQAMTNHDALPSGDSRRDWALGYAKAADSRMNDLGCYG